MNRPLRVAWDNSLTRRNPTGTGVYAARLIQQLIAKPSVSLKVFEGWDPDERKPGEFGSQGILARGVRAISGLVWSHAYFPRQLQKEKFDLLHSPAFLVPFWCPCPSIATIHDVSFLIFPEHFERRWRTYLNHMMPAVMRSVAAVICVSENTKRDLLRFYQVPPSKLHVVYDGVDHMIFHPGVRLDSRWAQIAGLSKDYILHVGTLSQRKNIPVVLRAVALLRARGKVENYQLVLAGPDLSVLSGGAEIRESIHNLGLEDAVVFTGYVPDDQMAGLVANAKLLVMPSVYEGFGLPVLEAMASGVPVIASDSSSLPEVGGDAVILVPPHDDLGWADAIADVLLNETVAREMRSKGLARAREFSWQRAGEETIAVYHSVAG